MKEWLKAPKLYLTLVAVLAVGVLATHFIDSKYYTNKINHQAARAANEEDSYYDDFNNLADITVFKYANINPNCNMFKIGNDVSSCQAYETSKQALEGKT